MEWIESLFTIHSAVQTVVVLSLITSLGLALGKIHIRGISLGMAFVFFALQFTNITVFYHYICALEAIA